MEFDTNKAKYPWSFDRNISAIRSKIPAEF